MLDPNLKAELALFILATQPAQAVAIDQECEAWGFDSVEGQHVDRARLFS